jgi:hypothetical protein
MDLLLTMDQGIITPNGSSGHKLILTTPVLIPWIRVGNHIYLAFFGVFNSQKKKISGRIFNKKGCILGSR